MTSEVRMRVAYLVNQYPKVSHSFIRREIAALEAEGVEVERITIRPPELGLVDEADRNELARTQVLLDGDFASQFGSFVLVALWRFPSLWRAARLALRIGWSSERGLLRHAAYLVEACTLLRRLSARRVQHLHAHFGTNPSTVATLCRVLGGPPFSFTVHCHEELLPAHARSFSDKVQRAAFVVAASAWVKKELTEWCSPREQRKVHVVHCGVSDLFLGQAPAEQPESRQLVCVARVCADKGLLFLLEAAARLAAEDRPFELVLVGDGPDRASVEERIQALGLADRARVTGWKTEREVRDFLISARALVLPSLMEGLPVVIMEAMALHRPVIATDVGAISELVETGVSGWLISPGSVDALASAMSQALEAPPELLERMGSNGAGRIRRRHDARREGARLMDLFRQTIERGGPLQERSAAIHTVSPDELGRGGESGRLGIVVIGRNEGERLVTCLRSVEREGVPIVYVDSGSTDGSADRARGFGCTVVALDSAEGYTAARARNTGFEQLTRDHPEIELVQFVDGDCELQPGWLRAGRSFLNANADVALLCGHLRERSPSHGSFRRLAEVEWASVPGEVHVTTGTTMVRAEAFASIGGFRREMVGGEEPDLCLRLHSYGARVVKIDCEMALHDMTIAHVGQWWRRCVRAGYSYADLYVRHGATYDPQWRRKLLSIAVWAVFLPLAILLAMWWGGAWGIVLPCAYGVLFARIVHLTRARGVVTGTAALYACACIVGKFAELEGVIRFLWSRVVRRRPSRLIEYRKTSSVR